MKRLARIPIVVLAVPVTLILAVLVLVVGGAEVFRPGALSTQNRKGVELEGATSHATIRSCSACHAPFWSGETMATRCLACHTDVRDQLDGQQPMHGSFTDGGQCRDCHTEHKGAHASLTS